MIIVVNDANTLIDMLEIEISDEFNIPCLNSKSCENIYIAQILHLQGWQYGFCNF